MKQESELKQATVLFADISGFTAMSEKMSPEEITTIMNDCFNMMGSIIKYYDGRIDKFIGDCVMATFGVPTATENAAQKAVNSAIEIRNKLYQFNKDKKLKIPLDIHIGINSGNVLAGEVGSDEKKEYTVLGDTVNLAARLEDISQTGQILVGSLTYRSTKADFEYNVLKPVKVKGKEKPVPVFELVSKKEKIHRRVTTDRIIQSEMVGRETEMDRLELAVVKTKNGEGSIVNIIGEAGIGKSRLIAELKNSDVVKRTILFEGRALSMGRNLAFYPIIGILNGLAGIGEDDTAAEELFKLEKAVKNIHPENADEIIPFVASLMGLQLSGKYAERVKGISGAGLEKLIYKNLRDLILQSAKASPLIFILEDLHWSDTSSIDLITSLCGLVQNNKILMINIFRPHYEETGEKLKKAVEEKYSDLFTEIYIHRLDTNQSDLLINSLLKIEGIPTHIRDLIKERSEGNPFFIEEMARSMIDEGAIEIQDGKFSITQKIDSVVVPNTIQELLMSRIDRLDVKTKSLLRTASVIGRHFFHKILTEVMETANDIDDKLGYLQEIQLIREGKSMEEVEYLFKHALAQETTYESILMEKRREIHLKVAESFERVFHERLHEFYGVLAYHFIKAENLDKAEAYMIKAGGEAMKSAASTEALEYFQKSFELYTQRYKENLDPSKLAKLDENIARAFYHQGIYGKAADHFTAALELLGYRLPNNKISMAVGVFYGFLSMIKYLYLPGFRKNKIPNELDLRVHSMFYQKEAALALVDGKRFFIESFCNLKRVLQFDFSHSVKLYNKFVSLSVIFSSTGISFSLSRRILDQASEIRFTQKTELPFYKNYHDVFEGNWNLDFDEDILKTFIKDGDVFNGWLYLALVHRIYLATGKFQICEKIIDWSYKIMTDFGDDRSKFNFHHNNLFLYIEKRDFPKAIDHNKSLYQFFDIGGQEMVKLQINGYNCYLHVLLNNLGVAENYLMDAQEEVKRQGRINISGPIYNPYLLGKLYYELAILKKSLAEDNINSTRKQKKIIKPVIKEAKINCRKYPWYRTEIMGLVSAYYWLINKQKKALKWFDKSIKEGERHGTRPALSRTYMEVGKRLMEPKSKYKHLNGITAEEYLEKARVMFEEMDLQWDLEQLEKGKRGEQVPIV